MVLALIAAVVAVGVYYHEVPDRSSVLHVPAQISEPKTNPPVPPASLALPTAEDWAEAIQSRMREPVSGIGAAEFREPARIAPPTPVEEERGLFEKGTITAINPIFPAADCPAAGNLDSPTEHAPPEVPAKPPMMADKETISESEWGERVAWVLRSSATTVRKLQMLRTMADEVVVAISGKIWDIIPISYGGVEIVVCPEHGGKPETKFRVAPENKDEVMHWLRWDRLGWICEVKVHGIDSISLIPLYDGPSSLKHWSNQGATAPKLERAKWSMRTWLRHYWPVRDNRAAAWRYVAQALNGGYWFLTGSVRGIEGNCVTVYVSSYRWTITAEVIDLQVLNGIRNGCRVQVRSWITTNSGVYEYWDGNIQYHFVLRKKL